MGKVNDILKDHWGYDSFRPLQEDIIHSVLDHQDVLALLPTGGGKSICFQVPALAMEGICLVITPLIALMKDQVEQLRQRGIKAEAIFSGIRQKEIDIILDNCIYGNVKFLYISPERLETELFRERVIKMNVCLLAVDEAHCISQWGYDFRPAYLNIASIRQVLPDVSVIALTASATPDVVVDIQEKLLFKQENTYQKSFARGNLSYAVRQVEAKEKKLLEVLRSVPGTAIVYVGTRKATKEIARFLLNNGISADFYHGGLAHDERSGKQEAWLKGKVRVIVSTNAFGMGIDKPDVRLVVHMDLTQDLESYYQEAGRAGRDEKKAYAVILCNESDMEALKAQVSLRHPPIDTLKKVYQAMANYYKLAIGSGQGQSFDFDIREFSEHYGFGHLEVFHALKKLEDEGLITFNESYYHPSHLHMLMDNTDLYKFQVANAHFDLAIKAMLRLYGGEMFNHFVNISERQLAKFMETTEKETVTTLTRLDQLKVIVYDKRKDKPQVIFTLPRQDVNYLSLNKAILESRKKVAEQKVASVINYAKHQNRCRTRLLLDYFGEIQAEACGVCDICIAQKKQHATKKTEDYHHQIEHLLGEGPLLVEELMEKINPTDRDAFLDVIRSMVDRNELCYDGAWKLSRT